MNWVNPLTRAIWRRWIEFVVSSGSASGSYHHLQPPYGLKAGASKANHLNSRIFEWDDDRSATICVSWLLTIPFYFSTTLHLHECISCIVVLVSNDVANLPIQFCEFVWHPSIVTAATKQNYYLIGKCVIVLRIYWSILTDQISDEQHEAENHSSRSFRNLLQGNAIPHHRPAHWPNYPQFYRGISRWLFD